jgi:hypothetical protein
VGLGRSEGVLVLKAVARLAAVAITLATGALVSAASQQGTVGHRVRLDEWHHLYLGLALAGCAASRRQPWVLLVAALIAVDDGWQHVRQAMGDWTYASPLHEWFGAYLWPLAPVRWIVAHLDAVFG